MALLNIQTIEEANNFLVTYLPKYNKKFTFSIKDTKSVFEKLPRNQRLEHILARFSRRVIQNGHSIKYQNKEYHLHNENERVLLRPKTRVMIIETLDGKLYASHGESIFKLDEIAFREERSEAFDKPIKPKVKATYIHPQTHPWKWPSFERYLRMKNRKEKTKT